jgi:hypothetical protein
MNILATVLGFFKSLFNYLNNKKLIDAGKAEAELEGRKEIEATKAKIDSARNNNEIRIKTRKKYTIDKK